MKKQHLKSLSLNKNKISNLVDNEVKGGLVSDNTFCPGSVRFCSFACTLACGNTTGPAPSTVPACYDK
ncbi:hypothetical protein [Kordia jejudonensis]|uniref:hypothetical protein n=1 Tax=Kordia jejudonensis TaxID=1348245 RepID=UPI000629BC5F|nr:hypothetical protein [Kordia jejudonensis]